MFGSLSPSCGSSCEGMQVAARAPRSFAFANPCERSCSKHFPFAGFQSGPWWETPPAVKSIIIVSSKLTCFEAECDSSVILRSRVLRVHGLMKDILEYMPMPRCIRDNRLGTISSSDSRRSFLSIFAICDIFEIDKTCGSTYSHVLRMP